MLINNTIIFDTKIGRAAVSATHKGIYSLNFNNKIINYNSNLDLIAVEPIINGILIDAKRQILEYLLSKRKTFDLPLQLNGTTFQYKSWQELIRIPYGNTISYKEQAINIGSPKAFRAIGSANKANKIPIIIPCHRVINNNGNIGGYVVGAKIKKFLIDLERNNSY